MSLTQRVKQGFLRLPFSKKAILFSSGLLMVSTVMPWYDERNSFGIGDTFLGVQGPLFLVGLLVLGFGAITFFNLFFPLMGRNFFNLRRRGGSVALLLGAQSLLLLAVANSVFYHPQFGLNLTNKGTRFGMMTAFFAVGAMMISGWMTRRKESEESVEMEAYVEPVEVERAAAVSPVFTPMPNPQPVGAEPGLRPVVDPLTLDAKTRYRMMQAQDRYSARARTNLWGSGNGSPYGAGRSADQDREQPMDF
jgi:hypothetical protein